MSKKELYTKYGALLKDERERQQLDLEELSEQLKINLEHLEAIESGDINSLPSELYFGLFAKSYSEALGLDYTRTMEAMKEEFDEAARREDRKARKSAEAREQSIPEDEGPLEPDVKKGKRFTGRLLLVFALLIVAFLVFVFVAERLFDGAPSSADTHAEESGDQVGTVDEAMEDRETDRYGDYDWNAIEPYAQPEKIRLALSAERDSWITVVADGDTVVFRQLDAGRSAAVTADYRLRVSISVPSAVTTRLNDELVDLRDPQTRRVSRVEINQANVDRFLNPEKYISQAVLPEPQGEGESGGEAPDDAADEGTESQ